jgi:MFS family permease
VNRQLPEAERLSPAPPVPESGARRALRLATIDVGPLRRHRDFRLLFLGQATTFFGSMITYVAIPFQTYALTGSSLAVGLLGLAELAPLLVTAFLGGALADAVDRRRLVRITELALMLTTAILLANSLVGAPRLWVLFAVAATMAGLDGLQRPPLEALTPRLVERDELPAAAALDSLRATLGMVAGPAVGGLLIAAFGLPWTYGVDLVTFAVSLLCLSAMRAVPPPPDAAPPSLRSIREGFRYAVSRDVLVGTYAVDIVAMFFGMPLALFPALAADLGGAGVLGLLYAAPSVGSTLATLTSG